MKNLAAVGATVYKTYSTASAGRGQGQEGLPVKGTVWLQCGLATFPQNFPLFTAGAP